MKKVVNLLLILILLAGIGAGIYFMVKNKDKIEDFFPSNSNNKVIAITNTGEEIKAGGTYKVPSALAFVCSDKQDDNAFNLSVSFKPSYAIDKTVEWYCKWENPKSTWASDKDVLDYVGLNFSENKTDKCLLTYKKAFSERIIVVVALRSDEQIKTTCVIDCMQVLVGAGTHIELNNEKLYQDFQYCKGYYADKGKWDDATYNSMYPHKPNMAIRRFLHVYNNGKYYTDDHFDRLSASKDTFYDGCYILPYIDGLSAGVNLSGDYTIPISLSDSSLNVKLKLAEYTKDSCVEAGLHLKDDFVTFNSFNKKRTGFYDPTAGQSGNYLSDEATITDFNEDILKNLFSDSLDFILETLFTKSIPLQFLADVSITSNNNTISFSDCSSTELWASCFEVVVQDIELNQGNIIV